MTRREKDVMEHLVSGKTNKQIALALGISPYTVRDHLSSLMRKMDVESRTGLITEYLLSARELTP
ncbi:hypothetical protein A7D25_01940 [Pseudomonas sp. 21C1]|uniref:response regulator transcription factor n=1 Tax=Pseudomonas TaxID=286 RepID=UPI00084B139F|nr:hypothetical protein A7D25_01940 [Pseudomonas sp. 21C1]